MLLESNIYGFNHILGQSIELPLNLINCLNWQMLSQFNNRDIHFFININIFRHLKLELLTQFQLRMNEE